MSIDCKFLTFISGKLLQQDCRTSNGPVMDHNVVPVYRMGITGDGVTVMVVDCGIDHNHPDLTDNFVS